MPACIEDNGDGTLTWNAGDLAASAMTQCIFSVQVNRRGRIVLTGTASSDLTDPDGGNSSNISNTVFGSALPVPALSLWALLALMLMTVLIARRRISPMNQESASVITARAHHPDGLFLWALDHQR